MTEKQPSPPILRNLDNFPPGTFYSTPLQLGTKEYVLKCTKNIEKH